MTGQSCERAPKIWRVKQGSAKKGGTSEPVHRPSTAVQSQAQPTTVDVGSAPPAATQKPKGAAQQRPNGGKRGPISGSSWVGKVLGGAGSAIWGREAGNVLGRAGDWFAKVIGLGDYTVQQNSVMSGLITGTDPPIMHSTGTSTVVRHREYIGDVTMSVDFAQTVYAVNPGLPKTFPWLAAIAQNYQQYKWKGLMFEYKTSSSPLVSSTNPAMGMVMMASSYDVSAPMFANRQQLLENQYSVDAKPSDNVLHPVECAPALVSNNWYYTRSGAVPANRDPRLYDMMYLTVATQGSQVAVAGTICGELWATYEIELEKPTLRSNFALDTPMSSGVGASASTTLVDAAYRAFVANTASSGTGSSLDTYPLTTGVSGSGSSAVLNLTIPRGIAGLHIVEILWVSDTDLGRGTPSAPTFTGATASSQIFPNIGNTGTYYFTGAGYVYFMYATRNYMGVAFTINNPSAGATVTLPIGTMATATSNVYALARCCQVNSTFAYANNGNPVLSAIAMSSGPRAFTTNANGLLVETRNTIVEEKYPEDEHVVVLEPEQTCDVTAGVSPPLRVPWAMPRAQSTAGLGKQLK